MKLKPGRRYFAQSRSYQVLATGTGSAEILLSQDGGEFVSLHTLEAGDPPIKVDLEPCSVQVNIVGDLIVSISPGLDETSA